MAILDIDRHILSDVMMNKERKKADFIEFAEQWKILCDVANRGDVLYWTECSNKEEKLRALKDNREQFFKAMGRIGRIALRIQSCESKEESLLMHLIAEIKKVDTAKGREKEGRK